jgi:3-oxoacyl-[acyl-carrier-protein] synthase II
MAAEAMRRALASAGLGPADVAGVSAHATGTRSGDAAETTALGLVLGAGLADVPVTAPKSTTGHLIGASGAVAAVTAALGLAAGRLPPTLGFQRADEGSRLDVVHGAPRRLPGRGAGAVLVNCFGFGGQNVSLCLGRAS